MMRLTSSAFKELVAVLGGGWFPSRRSRTGMRREKALVEQPLRRIPVAAARRDSVQIQRTLDPSRTPSGERYIAKSRSRYRCVFSAGVGSLSHPVERDSA